MLLTRFGGELESLRIACGKPSYAQLRRSSAALPPATTSDVLRGKSNPRVEFVLAFVTACQEHAGLLGLEESVTEAATVLWERRWRELQTALQPGDGQERRHAVDGSADGDATALLARAARELGPNEDVAAAECVLRLSARSSHRLALALRTAALVHLHHLLGEPLEAQRLVDELRNRAGHPEA